MKTVFFAGGGTGGHVFPLVAVAQAMGELCPEIRPVFVGTERGMETRLVPSLGFELELLRVLPIRGGGLTGALRGAARAALLLPEGRRLLGRYQPLGVFSAGGYAAGPISLAGRLLGLPVGLLEPNSVIGLANQLIAPFVQRAYTAFELTESKFSPAVVRPLGVPIRPGFSPRPYELQPGRLRVLVLGGSQGAQSLNERVPEALTTLQRQLPGLSVVHQCGASHVPSVERAYLGWRPESVEITPFINDMPAALGRADLVIGRSGASAVSEIAAIGRPSLLIPYPYASGDHQRVNAEVLARRGAAVALGNSDATVQRLAAEIAALCSRPEQLGQMARAAARIGRPEAARDIALDFLDLIGMPARPQVPERMMKKDTSSPARLEFSVNERERGSSHLSAPPRVEGVSRSQPGATFAPPRDFRLTRGRSKASLVPLAGGF